MYVLFSLMFVWGSAFVSQAQERTGNVEGSVMDQNDAAIPGAEVTIVGLDIGFSKTVSADDQGAFRVLQIPPGRYKLSVASSGFRRSESQVTVSLGQTQSVKFSLAVEGSSATVEVTTADTASIDIGSNKIQTNIDDRRIEMTPKATVNFAGVLRVSPAVREEPLGAGFQIDGSSGAENTFIVDGLEVTNFRNGQLRNVQNVSNDIVSEVQVKTSGFEAEYSGATGGVVNVVTRGGNNQFHGNFGAQFNLDRLDADARPILRGLTDSVQYITPRRDNSGTFLNPPDDEFTNFFPTANVSGPIIKDRLWFFGSVAPQFFNTNRTSVFPNGTRETNRVETRRDYIFARLDGQITDELRATGTYSYSPQTINGGILGFGATAGIGDQSQKGGRVNATNFTYGVTYTPTTNWVVSLRGGRAFLNEKDASYGVPSGFRVRCSGSATVLSTLPNFGCGASNSIGFDNIGDTTNTFKDVSIRNTFDGDAQVFVNNLGGRHILKVGYQFNRVENDVDSGFFNTGQLRYFFGQTAFGVGSTLGNIQLTRFGTAGRASSKNQGLYVQDSWQPFTRLTLNLGVRIEKEDVPTFGAVGVPIEFNWGDKAAPRIGGAYDIFGDGKSKIFASYGWFYDRFKYELPRGSFGGDQFLRTFLPILPGDNVNTFTSVQSVLNAVNARSGITLDFRVPSNDPSDNRVDPDLKAQRMSEFTVGFEQDLSGFGRFFRNSVLRARYTHKQLDEAVEDVGFFDNAGNENFFIANPGRGIVGSPFASGIPATPDAERKYDAFELTLDKRFANNYFINGTYTYSRLKGNFSGLASSDERGRSSPNVNRFFDLPFLGFDVNGNPDNGRLATDRPHAIKFFGGYTFDWFKNASNSTDFTFAFLGTSGTPISTQASLFNANTFVFGRGDLGRTPTFTQTDLGVSHHFKLGDEGRYSFSFDANFINLFNENNVTDVYNILTASDVSGQEAGFNLFNNCPGGTCDELNTIRAIFNGGIQSRLLNLANSQVQIGTANGQPVLDTITRDARYGQPLSFQQGRQVRLGVRFNF
jgi:hypothetical protein